MTAEELALKIERVDARSRSNTHRIEEIERNQSALTDLALSVKELATKQGGMERDLTVMKSDIKTLTGKPAKRWDGVVTAIITALISVLVGAVLGRLI